ncbi:MAG: hypothetical protein U0236_23065, partial [Nitrospira sp.]
MISRCRTVFMLVVLLGLVGFGMPPAASAQSDIALGTSEYGASIGKSFAFAEGCEFRLGFKRLHDLIPDKVGDCLENEHIDPETGDTVQATSGGMLAFRPSSQRISFTDGYRTWLIGPNGLEQRLNTERFSWENTNPSSSGSSPSATSPTATSPPMRSATATPNTPPVNQPVRQPAEPSIDSRLLPAWSLLISTVTPDGTIRFGEAIRMMLEESGASIRLDALPSRTNGVYLKDSNLVAISSLVLRESRYVQATIIAHEVAHARQYTSGLYDWERNCIEMEVASFYTQAVIWGIHAFNLGYWPMSTTLERENTMLWKTMQDAEAVGLTDMEGIN